MCEISRIQIIESKMEISLKPAQQKNRTKKWINKNGNWMVIFTGLIVLVIWYLITVWSDLPAFILPSPLMIWNTFIETLLNGTLIRHFSITLLEVLLGLTAGTVIATIIGYLLAKSPTLEKILSPYLVASQAIPTVAIAPLLVIWFGPGLFSKVLIAALIVFFPVLVNTVVGVNSVPKDLRDLMRSLRASKSQTLRYLEIPAALPIFLGGLRIGATLSVIGAVVGEFVGADRGLGFLINVGRGQYDTALVFVAIFALIGMALGLYGTVIFMEKRLLIWQHQTRKSTVTESGD
jgi:NitT/TauT family transport system permease protein